MSAADMVNECFRHQHPEAYGRPPVEEPLCFRVVAALADADYVLATPVIGEEPMGNGEALV